MGVLTVLRVLFLAVSSYSLEINEIELMRGAIRQEFAKLKNGTSHQSLKIAHHHQIHLPHVPQIKAKVLSRWDENVSEENTEDSEAVRLVCGDNCFSPTGANLTLPEMKRGLSYQVVNEDGVAQLVEIEVDEKFVDYVNKWQTDDQESLRHNTHARKRREVIEDDTRFVVYDKDFLNNPPFSATVRISTGCSGVLVSENHVLTAASCVHDGRRYIERLRDIQIGVRQRRALSYAEERGEGWKETFRWYPARQIFIPSEWNIRSEKGARRRQTLPLEKNYALIEIRRKLDRGFLNVSVGSVATVSEGQRIHFSSFDDPVGPLMMYRFCRVKEETMEILYQECDSTEMSQGAGIYVRQWNTLKKNWDRKIVGVFGGYKIFYNEAGQRVDRNIAVKLTPLKFAQICFWMTGDYGECRG